MKKPLALLGVLMLSVLNTGCAYYEYQHQRDSRPVFEEIRPPSPRPENRPGHRPPPPRPEHRPERHHHRGW